MRTRLSLHEIVLLLILFAALLLILLSPIFQRPRRNHHSNCRANLHHLGMALADWSDDNKGLYVKGKPRSARSASCQTLGWMIDGEYIDDKEMLISPGFEWERPRRPHLLGAPRHEGCITREPPGQTSASTGTAEHLNLEPAEMCYFLDEFRIHPRSQPGRVIAATSIAMCTRYGVEPPCYRHGSNVLFFDLSVKWVPLAEPQTRFVKDGDHVGMGGSAGYSARAGPWVRWGYVPNPRLDEDEHFEDVQEAHEADFTHTSVADRDDIYECEGDGPDALRVEQSDAFGDPDPPARQTRRSLGRDSWYSLAPEARCSGKRVGGGWGLSKTDCALGGGAMSSAGSWRNKLGFYSGDNAGRYDGWTWGVPEPYEDEVY